MNHLSTLSILAALCLICLCAGAGAQPARIAVIGHRGASEYAPENTLASFALAAEMKADYFELDCALSRDGEIFICHDLTVDRTTSGTGVVGDLTTAELRKLDAGSWKDPKFAGERLPTLRESLELAHAKKIGVYIEVKDVNRENKKGAEPRDKELEARLLRMASGKDLTKDAASAKRAIAVIERYGTPNLPLARKTAAQVHELKMEKEVVIQSFSPVVCLVVRLENPDLRVEYLVDDNPKKPEVWKNFLVFAKIMNAAGCNLGVKAAKPERIEAFHKEGRTVAVWTIDKEAEIKKFAEMGADAIITNKPDVCLKVLQEMGKHE